MSKLIQLHNNNELNVVTINNTKYIQLHRADKNLNITLAELPLSTSTNDEHNIKIFIKYILHNVLIQNKPCNSSCKSELFYVGKGGFSIALWFKCFDDSCSNYTPIILKMFKPNKLVNLLQKKKKRILDIHECLETNNCIDYQRELFAAKLINNSCPFICNYYGYFLVKDDDIFQGDLNDNSLITQRDLQQFLHHFKGPSNLQFFFLDYMDFSLSTFYSKIHTLDHLYNKDIYTNGIMYLFYFLYDICIGLDKMNAHNLIHCDIKLDNIMVKYNKDKTHFYFVIIDLGSPSVYDNQKQIFLRQGVHSKIYVDFEFVKKKFNDVIIHDTFERDTWALGITLLDIISNIMGDTELNHNVNRHTLIEMEGKKTAKEISSDIFLDQIKYIQTHIHNILQNVNNITPLYSFNISRLKLIVKSMMSLYRSQRFSPTQVLLELNQFILQESGLGNNDKFEIYNHIKNRYTSILNDRTTDIYNIPILSDLMNGINKYLRKHTSKQTNANQKNANQENDNQKNDNQKNDNQENDNQENDNQENDNQENDDSANTIDSIPDSLKSLQSFESLIKP